MQRFRLALAAYVSLASCAAPEGTNYRLDNTWAPQFPVGGHTYSAVGTYSAAGVIFVSQRGNTSVSPVLVFDTKNGTLIHEWGKNVSIAISHKKGSPPQWGDHGLSIETCDLYPSCGGGSLYPGIRVYIEDWIGHTVTAFTSEGERLFVLGKAGVAGNSTNPLLFENVADAAVVPATQFAMTHVYVTDGDGGTANRVVKVAVPGQEGHGTRLVEWATPAIYDNPHSIAVHHTGLLILADREQNEIRLLDSKTGQDRGVWNCGIPFGTDGRPNGIRTMRTRGLDLVVVASMDDPETHMHQKIHILDGSKLSMKTGAQSVCYVLQTIVVDPDEYSGPHLLGVDEINGDIYAALVTDDPKSTILRYRME